MYSTFFHDNDPGDLGTSPHFWHHEGKHYLYFSGSCVGTPANKNLFGPQKEILKWHWKLGIGMYCIQTLMCERHYEELDGKTTILPAIISQSMLRLEIVLFHLVNCVS